MPYGEPITPDVLPVADAGISSTWWGRDLTDEAHDPANGLNPSGLSITSFQSASFIGGVLWSRTHSAGFGAWPLMDVHEGLTQGLTGFIPNGLPVAGGMDYDHDASASREYIWDIDVVAPPDAAQYSQNIRESVLFTDRNYVTTSTPWKESDVEGFGVPGQSWAPEDSGYTMPPGAIGWEAVEPGYFVRQALVVYAKNDAAALIGSGQTTAPDAQYLVARADAALPGNDWDDHLHAQGWAGAIELLAVASIPDDAWSRTIVTFADGYKFPDTGYLWGVPGLALMPGGPIPPDHPQIVASDGPALDEAPYMSRFVDPTDDIASGLQLSVRFAWQWWWQPPTFRWAYTAASAPPQRVKYRDDGRLGQPQRTYPRPKSRQSSSRIYGGYL